MPHASAVDLHVRHPHVDWGQPLPRYWNGGDPYRSILFNALSLMFPRGERFFINAVRAGQARIATVAPTELLRDIKLFVAQESIHGQQHKLYNDQIIAQRYDPWVDRVIERIVSAVEGHSVRFDLAVTAAFEHYTAILGDGLLRHDAWTADMTDTMRELWRWHAMEEAEHKAVAFDVYQALGGGYLLRVSTLVYASLFFVYYIVGQTSRMLRHDGLLWRWPTWRSAFKVWLGRGGMVHHGLPLMLAYFKPGFHPWNHDNRDLLKKYQDQGSSLYPTPSST